MTGGINRLVTRPDGELNWIGQGLLLGYYAYCVVVMVLLFAFPLIGVAYLLRVAYQQIGGSDVRG